jgi:hypothetical protein
MTADELEQLLRERFDLGRDDLIAALKTLPPYRPYAATLTADEARLLDAAGLTEDPNAYAKMAADVIADMGRLYSTAYSAADVANGLGVNHSWIRRRRLSHTLWAIADGGSWVYPAAQFELVNNRRGAPLALEHVRGLDGVLPKLLTKGLHPAAVASFLLVPQHELLVDRQPTSVRDWLLHGGPEEPVLDLIEIGDWAAT